MSGNDIGSSASAGDVQVIVKQDGIGRTGGIIVAVFSGLAFGISIGALVLMLLRDNGLREQMQKTEKENRLTQYYLMDPHSRTPEELAAWAKFNREREVK